MGKVTASLRLTALLIYSFNNATVTGITPRPVINIINLDRDTKRWRKISQHLIFNGIADQSIRRYSAVDGNVLSQEDLQQNATLLTRLLCTPGMIGCYLSHRNLWAKVYRETRHEFQLILEDDVETCDNFPEKVTELIEELQAHEETKDKWDVLLLGAFGAVHPDGKFGIVRHSSATLLGQESTRTPSITMK
ncbi:hypothetical protein ACHAWF_017702 [Thalassiosira exigua]